MVVPGMLLSPKFVQECWCVQRLDAITYSKQTCPRILNWQPKGIEELVGQGDRILWGSSSTAGVKSI